MAISASDISLVLSGGSGNQAPNSALGGSPSATPVASSALNNLFADVTPEQATVGLEDYRCLYLFNDGEQPVYNLNLWIDSQLEGGSSVEIGIEEQNESQRITISGATVTGGSLTVSYLGFTVTTSYNPDLGVWASNLQDGLNSLKDDNGVELLRQTVVRAQNNGSTLIFDVTFTGLDGKRDHELIQIADNNLTPTVNTSVVLTLQGSPINTIAPAIDVATTPPGGVAFFAYSSILPIVIPKLSPADGFPFWVKRVTPAGTESTNVDGFTLRAKMETLNPLG